MEIWILANAEPDGSVSIRYYKSEEDVDKQIDYEQREYNCFNQAVRCIDAAGADIKFDEPDGDDEENDD